MQVKTFYRPPPIPTNWRVYKPIKASCLTTNCVEREKMHRNHVCSVIRSQKVVFKGNLESGGVTWWQIVTQIFSFYSQTRRGNYCGLLSGQTDQIRDGVESDSFRFPCPPPPPPFEIMQIWYFWLQKADTRVWDLFMVLSFLSWLTLMLTVRGRCMKLIWDVNQINSGLWAVVSNNAAGFLRKA